MQYLMLFLILLLPCMAHAEMAAPGGTRIDITATADATVANDEVVITFRIEKSGPDTSILQQYVNSASKRIAERLKKEKGVKQQTLSRNLQAEWKYPKNSERIRSGWQLTQTEQVTSTNLEAVAIWVKAIEEAGAHLSGIQFRISDATAKSVQSRLRMEAVANFRSQSNALAKSLAAKSFRIIRLSSSAQTPRPLMIRAEKMAMMAADAAPAPSLSAGEGKISVSISGEIELPFIDYPVR